MSIGSVYNKCKALRNGYMIVAHIIYRFPTRYFLKMKLFLQTLTVMCASW